MRWWRSHFSCNSAFIGSRNSERDGGWFYAKFVRGKGKRINFRGCITYALFIFSPCVLLPPLAGDATAPPFVHTSAAPPPLRFTNHSLKKVCNSNYDCNKSLIFVKWVMTDSSREESLDSGTAVTSPAIGRAAATQ